MRELLLSGIRRYIRSIIFWFAVIVTIVFAIVCGHGARTYYVNPVYILATLITNAVMISWLVGREYEEGIFRNKVISGHSKGSIYFSELILGVAASVILYLLFSLIFFSFNGYVHGYALTDICIKLFLGCLLANVCITSIFVALSSLIPYRAIVVVVNMVLIFTIMLATFNMHTLLNEPEFVQHSISNDSGADEGADYSQGTELLTKNADYIEEPLRSVLTITYHLSPCVNIVEGFNLTYDWFSYELPNRIDPFNEKGLTWEDRADFSVTDEEEHNLNVSVLYTAVEFVLICTAGYFSFRKKELK